MRMLDIGEVAAESGVSASALRHYEAAGLIASAGRHGLRRQFPPQVLMQLQLIAMGKAAGFSLEEIASVFGQDGMPELPRAALHQKADVIERTIMKLATLRDTLRHVAECPAPSHLDCPTFRGLMENASRLSRVTARKRAKPPKTLKRPA